MLKNIRKLEEYGFIKSTKDTSGPRTKKILHITFRGVIFSLHFLEKYNKEAKLSIKLIITKHPELFPFSTKWRQICKIVGEDVAYKKLIKTVSRISSYSYRGVKIDHLDLEFKAFFPPIRS